ncbi:MAG: aromatic-ring-hydroxylating dioxygenase subunit beta [Polynucleobacter sp.]|jgi:salicylate 5-hydroxylase small subunit|nr:aromatic-ring-hydroxylating dioxygenase subunit beta [Polynucleobacter sp.]
MTTQAYSQTLFDLIHLYSDYAAAVDSAQWDKWIEFFTDECEYKIQPRENYERGFPLATLALLSKNMLKDRVYGIHETLYHDPYYQRHVVGLPIIREEKDNVIVAEANYAVFRTKLSGESTVFNVGRYLDRLTRDATGLKFISRLCIYDSEMIPNSIIYPI